ncbi:MAG TPA: CheR family methyltransferase, partial [Pirellulaceae bacterium]
MPRSAVAAGCVDFVMSPEDIAKELMRIAKHPYVLGRHADIGGTRNDVISGTENEDVGSAWDSGGRGSTETGTPNSNDPAEHFEADRTDDAENDFRRILLLLRNHSGVDFSQYKSTTIQRRINRRMVLNRHDTLEHYAEFLRGNSKELDALYSDVLISVTSFFRNPEAYDVLKKKVFSKLVQQPGDDPFRVWVLGCSTGQEAYSIAMAFMESMGKAPRMRRLQVFATDLN